MRLLRILFTLALLSGFFGLQGSVHGQANKVGEIMRDRSIDWKNPTDRAQAVQRIKKAEERELEKAQKIARQRGKPFREELPNGKIRELVGLDEDGDLLYYETRNTNAAISTGVDQINIAPFSLDGAGLLVGVWDAGSVLSTHQEFNQGVSSRVNVRDGAASDDHATHVGGTIGAYGVNSSAKGMAPQTTIESYQWSSDISEMTAAAATASGQFGTKIYLSNHSYGYSYGWRYPTGGPWTWSGTGTDQNAYDADFGQYSGTSFNLDNLAFNSPYYLIFWAAGNENNDGPNNGNTASIGGSSVTYNSSVHPQNDGDYSGGFDTIGDHGVAKNLITMGAANDAVTGGLRDPSKSTIASFSSTGPVDDGRIKPDLVANGVGLYSTVDSSNTAYGSKSGTSMSSPNATGSAALLVELYRELFGSNAAMRASTLKGLLIHTASDVGNPGPDYTYGWGLIDVKSAADLLKRQADFPYLESVVEDQLTTAQPLQTYSFSWDGSSPIRATLSWTDPAGSSESAHNERTPDLVNDLNLKLIAPDGTEYFPFVMPFVGTWTVASMNQNATTGVNNVDNVEQVLIDNPGQSGNWQVEVTYIGTLANNEQDYGLIVSGAADRPLSAIYPSGGETMYHDTIEELTWFGNITGNIKLELYKGGVFQSLIADNEENDGVYYWTVPSSLPVDSDYSIKVTSVDNPDDSDTTPTFSIAASFTPSPLAEALDATDLDWTTTGDTLWFSQATTTHDGVDAAESGNISDNQTSDLETTVSGPGTLTFWWKVSSESNYDYLRLFINNVEQTGSLAPISGNVDWVQETVSIPSGSQTVKWRYDKDFSVSSGSDTAWVDEVVYTPDNPFQGTPDITVEQPLQNYLSDAAATIDFGTQYVGNSSSPTTFTVSNSGSGDLTGLSLSKTGAHAGDYILGALGNTSLAPGESTTFTVTFSPTAGDTRTAAIEIASNDADENPFDINLTGFALDPTGLEVVIAANSVSEETGSVATSGTVTRNTDPSNELVVSLASSDETEATVPASVTILAGQSSAVFDIASVEDAELDGTQTVTVTASAPAHNDGSDTLDVADNESLVTYDGNGSDQGTAPAGQIKIYNTDLTLTGAGTLVRTGYDFDGWNTAADGSGAAYAVGATYSVNTDVTLYAQWDSGPAAIYEPFGQTAGSLNGQSGGAGLSGTWSINQTVNVVNPATMLYGDLSNAGGQVELPSSSGVDAWIATSSTLSDNNLLDDGATLWFSLVYQKTSGSGSNEHSGFAFGTERVDGAYNGVRMNTGYGVGFYTQAASISVATWNNGGQSTGGSHSITYSTPALIVGKIEWGATSGDDETITLYMPSLTDLANLGTGVSATVAGFDQTVLDTVSFTQRNSGGTQTYDEIRFGSTYESVIGQGASGTYKVTYDGNGSDEGTVPTDNTDYDADTTVVVLGNTGSLLKTGYIFTGWNTASDGSGTSYVADNSFTITDDVTLYAQWALNTAGFTLSKSTATVAENGGTDSFTVVLDSQPVSDVVIDLSSSDSNEATVSPASLTFTSGNWASAQTVTITGVNDDTAGDDTATITASVNDVSSADAYDALADQTVAVTCTGDESAGFLISLISGDTDENGMSATFTVALTSEPSGDVTIGLSSSDAGEGTVNSSSLTFTSIDWNSAQTVTVFGLDDALDDGDQAYSISTAAATSADSDYDTLDPNDVSVTNLDDDFTLSVVVGTGGDSVTGGGIQDQDSGPYAITATASAGYSFANWTVTTGSASFADANSASTTLAASAGVTVQANFTLVTYTVTYNGNGSDGGTVPIDSSSYNYNDSAIVLGNTGSLVKTGFAFTGWNTASDGSGTGYLANDNFTITDDVPLYAQWELNEAPVANIQTIDTVQDTAVAITLTASDGDSDELSYTVVTQPGNGLLSGTAPNLTYTPGVGYTGSDSFTFTVNDGTVDSNSATVSITVLTPFEDWGGVGESPTADNNGDGIADGMAWVLGASDPSSDASSLQPVRDTISDSDYYIFTYRRSDEAHNDSGTTIDVVYGDNMDMATWGAAVHDAPNIIIAETDDYYGPGVDRVEVKINWDLVTNDKIFTRLRVTVTP